ncbi:TetR/AcrR family transcriptional regulator [Pedobacter sp. ISL-68]|uniref:TetR/AcrR family transcriptional regulator n=2 Tax=unclassified Pedobacter TaxID=2628915 RepID=UPI001BE75383|nr:TetR/AcrR family transcriptional regulator [Pedobacter sp. ISL-68]MBT2560083.1 TetR/AcrR family transcriptional regulator [Pedobacter sp. ISL-64]MBT2589062.1 TetR/AcrR family transcriptional regulator [Pedobacter sp. ISL-68]
MTKKRYQGPSNDKERSMQKLIDAVGVVIKTKGYTGLSATNIAQAAGLSRRLITQYFDTIENLIETYVRGKDYWLATAGDAVDMIKRSNGNNTRNILDCLLQNQLDYFLSNEEMQKTILWQISERTKIMTEVCEERELLSKFFFALSDKELEGRNIDLRAVSAILVAGIYYLVLHAKSTDVLFCEVDLNKPEGMERIKNAISLLLKKTYES